MDVTSLIKLLNGEYFSKFHLTLTNLFPEKQNKKYYGARFILNNHSIRFRKSSCTPNKAGQFVAVWEKDTEGNNQALNYYSSPDFLMIYSETPECKGLFVFPKDIALKYGILATVFKKGKLGFRVYPAWDEVNNKQALQTKAWQNEYFVDLSQQDAKDKLNLLLK